MSSFDQFLNLLAGDPKVPYPIIAIQSIYYKTSMFSIIPINNKNNIAQPLSSHHKSIHPFIST